MSATPDAPKEVATAVPVIGEMSALSQAEEADRKRKQELLDRAAKTPEFLQRLRAALAEK